MSNDFEPKPVSNPEFWKHRLYKAHATGRGVHTAIYDIDSSVWEDIQASCHDILVEHLIPDDHILDAGCGYGALVSCLHSGLENVEYWGIDSSPDLIEVARLSYPDKVFTVGDINNLPMIADNAFDWAVCRSMREMVIDNLGSNEWAMIQNELLRVAKRLLVIEYEGEVTYSLVGQGY